MTVRPYDVIQAAAVLVCWLCCKRTVYATHPMKGCVQCR